MRNTKKLIALIAAAGIIGVSAGCGSAPEASRKVQDEETELSVLLQFDPAVDNQDRVDSFYEAGDKLGYKVNVNLLDPETYKIKIRVMLQGNELPDLFYVWGDSFNRPFIKANALYPIEDALEESGYKLEARYDKRDENGHNYVVPIADSSSYCLFYNKDVFEKIEKAVPENWEELLDVVDACNANGISAIGLGNKARWEGELLYDMLVLREDADAFSEAAEGKRAFTDSPFLEAARKIKVLRKENAFQNGYMRATPSESIELLKAGKLAMYPGGSWQISVMQFEKKLECAVFPKTGKEEPRLSGMAGSTDGGITVSANAKNPEAAAKLAVEYSKILNDHLAKSGEITYFETDVKADNQTDMMKTYIENTRQMEKTQLYWFNYLDNEIGEPLLNLVQQLYAGKVEPEGFVVRLEDIMRGNRDKK